MTRRTIEVSGFDASLSVRHHQVLVKRDGEIVGQFPADEIGLLIVDTPLTSFSNNTLVELVSGGGLVVLCGRDRMPAAWVVPVEGNSLQVQRFAQQMALSLPRRKRLWQQIVRQKIRNQAAICEETATAAKMKSLVARVGSGDSTNVEAHAARLHWAAYLPGGEFRRARDGPPPNHFLNYGYMMLRAAVARAICGAGLHPSLGLHHQNRSAGFPLADDLMEPLRPWADRKARALHRAGHTELDKHAKAALLGMFYERVQLDGEQPTLETAINRLVGSLVDILGGNTDRLTLPAIA